MKAKIETITSKTEKEVIQFLTMVTLNDPPNKLLFPDEIKRIFHSFRISRAFTKILGKFNERYLVRHDGEIAAVGMWIPPGKQITNNQLLQNGFLAIPFLMGIKPFRLLMRFLDISTKMQEDFMENKDHWNLFYLAENPKFRTHQYCAQILSSLISQSKKKKESIFAHCFDQEQMKLLKKNGFYPVSAINFSKDCTMYCLVKKW